jgi:hypothetical protein
MRSLAALPVDQVSDPPLFRGIRRDPDASSYDGQPANHRLQRIVIKADDMHRTSAARHTHDSSARSVILAAFAPAIHDVANDGPRQILMRSSIDMHRRLEPHVATSRIFVTA